MVGLVAFVLEGLGDGGFPLLLELASSPGGGGVGGVGELFEFKFDGVPGAEEGAKLVGGDIQSAEFGAELVPGRGIAEEVFLELIRGEDRGEFGAGFASELFQARRAGAGPVAEGAEVGIEAGVEAIFDFVDSVGL